MFFSQEEIRYDETFAEFLDARGITESTKRGHTTAMKIYCNYNGITPTELIEEAEKDQDVGIKRKKRKIRRRIITFVNYLRDNGKAKGTIDTYLTTIKAFYDDNDIDIPKLPKNLTRNKEEALNKAFDGKPTIEHVKIACNNSDIRLKAIILLQFSSGMGASEVRNVTYQNFIDSIIEYVDIDESDKLNVPKIVEQIKKVKDCIGTWKITRYKMTKPYVTFNTPESAHAIADYLLWRLKNNKPVKSLDDHLFVDNYNKQLSDDALRKLYARLNDRCGFGRRNNKFHFLTSHRLRVAFTTILYEAGIDKLTIDRLLGHRVGHIDDAYFKTTIERLKREYVTGIEQLSTEKVNLIRYDDGEVRKLIQKLDVTKSSVNVLEEKLKEKENEMTAMQEKVDKLESVLEGVLSEEKEN